MLVLSLCFSGLCFEHDFHSQWIKCARLSHPGLVKYIVRYRTLLRFQREVHCTFNVNNFTCALILKLFQVICHHHLSCCINYVEWIIHKYKVIILFFLSLQMLSRGSRSYGSAVGRSISVSRTLTCLFFYFFIVFLKVLFSVSSLHSIHHPSQSHYSTSFIGRSSTSSSKYSTCSTFSAFARNLYWCYIWQRSHSLPTHLRHHNILDIFLISDASVMLSIKPLNVGPQLLLHSCILKLTIVTLFYLILPVHRK